MMQRLLGLNIGGTQCSVVLGDGTGTVHRRVTWPSEAQRGPEAMIARLIDHARSLVGDAQSPQAVGAVVGGPMNGRTGVVLSPPNLPGWDGIALASLLSESLQLPVRVEHDAAACALAEYLWGAGRGVNCLAYLTCGTGFGVGLVINGEPYYAANGSPPEIGHIAYRDDGPTAFGKQGCFEAFASASALQRIAAWQFPNRWAHTPPSPPQISAWAQQGDAEAAQVIATNARAVGDAAALLVDLLGPGRILLGSASRYLGDAWIDLVRRQARSQAGAWADVRIEPAGLGDRLQDCSALAAACRAVAMSP